MDAIEGWNDFNVAMVGATAALAGLVIVAASVNIETVVRARTLTARLAAAIAALLLALVASAVGMVPGVQPIWYGAVVLTSSVAAGAFQMHATVAIMRDRDPAQPARISKSALGFLPIAAYLAAGVSIVSGHGSGLVLAATGCILAIVSAILISWIAIVEVLR